MRRNYLLGALMAAGAAATAIGNGWWSGSRAMHPPRKFAAGAATVPLHVYGSRTGLAPAADDKFDAVLADLARHSDEARAASPLADLHAMSPAAHFRLNAATAAPEVLIDAVTRGDPERLAGALRALGMERPVVFANDVGGWLPVGALGAAAARSELHSLRAAMSRTRTGAVTTQGDYAQRGDVVRSAHPTLTGSGVTVGILSDSYDCYDVYAKPGSGVAASGYAGYAYNGFTATAATDVTSGDIPAGVQVLAEADCLNYGAPAQPPFGDEGRAMMQVVHDVAPGAKFAFYTAENSEAAFAAGIKALAAAGAKVIADDVGYYDEPFFQDGIVAQSIDSVVAQGVVYFSAAGNDGTAPSNGGTNAYTNASPGFGTAAPAGPNAGEMPLNFDASQATTVTSLPISIDAMQPGQYAAIVVEWDQPYVTGAPASGGATSQIDVCVTGSGGDLILDYSGNPVACSGANKLGADPVQVMIVGNPANAAASTAQETLNLSIGLAGGSPAPGRLKLVVETDGQQSPGITLFLGDSATLQGHPGAAGAAAVAAAFYFDTPRCGNAAKLEDYSSFGGTPLLFDVGGRRLAAPVLRQKPDFVAPDGGNDTFLGFTLASSGLTGGKLPTTITQCQNDAAYPNFFGTSAATPHAAAIAALLLQWNPAATPTEIIAALQNSALAIGSAPNASAGYGFIQADAALALVPAGAAPVSTPPSGGGGGGGALDATTLAALAGFLVLFAQLRCRPRATLCARVRPRG